MSKACDLIGRRFGKLTVIEKTELKEDRYTVWHCRCDCGNECNVNTKRLNRGTITNCGCVPKKAMNNGSKAADLTDMVFGSLTALYRTENHGDRTAWLCRCVCGNEVVVTTHDLRAGKTKSCGCLSHANPSYRDLTGMQIGRLRVLSKTDKRDYKGSIYWRCRCSCGNVCLYSADSLIYGHIVSCGCYRKEVISANIAYQPHRVDGTCVERLLSTKARPDSKSGYVGIHIRKNGRYRATIGFKGKQYDLGTYEKLEDALAARRRGEEMHQDFLDWYYSEQGKEIAQTEMEPVSLETVNF